jgi:hypothetical protein
VPSHFGTIRAASSEGAHTTVHVRAVFVLFSPAVWEMICCHCTRACADVHRNAVCRKEKVTDKVLLDLTMDDLKSLGLTLGEARLFKKEAEALAAIPFSSPGSSSGAAAPSLLSSSSQSSATLQPTAAFVLSTDPLLKATAVPSHHLPYVSLSSLPPLTHVCGEPGASGSVFKIEYQGKQAAAKVFHKHMQSMLRRELKSLQLLAHPNIVRVMAVITDAESQPAGFVMECVFASQLHYY